MESLLSPSESHAFQSFLSSLDVSNSEWALYSSGSPDDIVVDVPVPHAQGREALTKATKELMSLDADRWNSGDSAESHQPRRPQVHYSYDYQNRQIGDHQQHAQRPAHLVHDPFNLNAHKYPSYPRPQPLQDPSYSDPQHLRPLIVPSIRTNGHSLQSNSSSTSATTSAATTPNTTISTPVYPFSQNGGPSSVMDEDGMHKPPSPRSKKQHTPGPSSSSSQKPNLLSPSQKKANHIQSEQKRRANIRRGYDALCETVPTLREAIKEEEERETETRTSGKANGRNATSKRAAKKKEADNSERIDGRAGPRSENVVLSKTIDYINELLYDRQALLNRLHRARAVLPLGHPALVPPAEQPLWEREWKGGEGKYGVKNGENGAGFEEDEEDEDSS